MNERRFYKLEKREIGEERQEKELNPEESKELGKEMKEYAKGLLERINEIKTDLELGKDKQTEERLRAELSDLEEQLLGLEEFIDDIGEEEYEKITVKDI